MGLLGIGLALLLGTSVRLAAAAGVVVMGFPLFAAYPLAQHDRTGALTGSTNPLTDQHFIHTVVVLVMRTDLCGQHVGGGYWAKLTFVHKNRRLV